MKIALILTGRLVPSEKQYENIMENILCRSIYPYEHVDIFIVHPKDESNETVEKIKHLYNPKIMIRSDELHINKDGKYNGCLTFYDSNWMCNRNNIFCMFYSRNLINNALKKYSLEKSINYDLIISTRFELEFEKPCCLYLMKSKAEKGFISIPANNDWLNGINDQIAYGNMENMNTYLELYNHIFDYLSLGYVLHPEVMLFNHLKLNNKKIFRYEYDYKIKRLINW